MIKATFKIKTKSGTYTESIDLFDNNEVIKDWKSKVEYIVKVEASGAELVHIRDNFHNLVKLSYYDPKLSTIWRGDLAKFIIDNI